MIGTALKNLAASHCLTVTSGKAYGYLLGSFVTLTESCLAYRLSIYVGSVNVHLPEGEELPPAAKCSALIADKVTKASGEENVYALLRSRFIPALVLNHSGSVVTIHFRRSKAGLAGLQRFILEQLPRITPLTAPLQCSHCGGHTQGQGYPVQTAPDTVVPMHAQCYQEALHADKTSRRTVAAVVAAAAGALIGAGCWASIFHAGLPAVLGALIILALTLGGYRLLRGHPGRPQAITVGICMTAAVLLGFLAGYIWMFHDQYAAYGTVVQGLMPETTYMLVAAKAIFTDKAALVDLVFNLSTGLVFSAFGAASALVNYKGCAACSKPKAMPGQA